ncbi:MAG: thiolase family protein [Deltaproteobacteria bacterium]|nr:thiolase family protein [Deltaproteobacteria bacterium]
MKEIVIAGACRTAVGTFGGIFKDVPAPELGVVVVKEALRRAGIGADVPEEVIFGCCMMRSDELNVARLIGLKAGLPVTTPAFTIQRQCASGMQAIVSAMQQIQTGEHEVVVAGGVENMTRMPYILDNMRTGARLGHVQAIDAVVQGLTDPIHGIHMGVTAENLAEKYDVSREDQDDLAYTSHMRAVRAIDEGWFKEQIVPVEAPVGRKKTRVCDTDEHPRKDTTREGLAKLRPAFKKDGTVTAGNSSGINDGAAAMVVMSAEKAKELGVTPMARIVDHEVTGVEPELMGYGPVPVVNRLMKRTGMSLDDFELIELNEAFAAQYLVCERQLGLDREKTNVNGSGISMGHPVGCTGARIVVSLIHELKRRGLKRGLATLCVGGGQGKAMVIELV